MAIISTSPFDSLEHRNGQSDGYNNTSHSLNSAVSWGAIVAGAVAGASLILLILGVGLGLSSVSPWAREGISAASFGVSTIVWLSLTQLLSSAMGGYLAVRLQTKWIDAHTDEVHFRDTAHGFLAWAVASLATAALLTSANWSILSGSLQAGASVVEVVANTATASAGGIVGLGSRSTVSHGPVDYFVDSLFRSVVSSKAASPTGSPAPPEASERTMATESSEIARIFMNVSRSKPLPSEAIRYVGQLVAQLRICRQPGGSLRWSAA